MTENVENLILEHLRALRGGQDRIELELKEVKARLTSLEGAFISSRRDAVNTQDDMYRQTARIDQIIERLDRLEKRMDLRDQP
jgi:chromosome segregation ATPase